MFKKFSTYICWKKYIKCLEGSGVPVLFIGRTVPKGKGSVMYLLSPVKLCISGVMTNCCIMSDMS
jgi:hypothetical protein